MTRTSSRASMEDMEKHLWLSDLALAAGAKEPFLATRQVEFAGSNKASQLLVQCQCTEREILRSQVYPTCSDPLGSIGTWKLL